jgi:FkbM family methyltransferase
MFWLALHCKKIIRVMNMREYIKKLIPLEIRNKLRYLLPSFLFRKISYSQSGEDILISFLLDMICGKRPKRYLDIGANHPFLLSNTALLYKAGGSGVLVEPDPFFADLLRKKRPRDEVLEFGVHFSGENSADFYVMDSPTLNTFSPDEMKRYVEMGHEVSKKIRVKLLDINQILSHTGPVDFMNLDIEGLDLDILQMIDWQTHRPKCICVESINYNTKSEPLKTSEIADLMLSKNYILYADTFINSIYVDREYWQQHWSGVVEDR